MITRRVLPAVAAALAAFAMTVTAAGPAVADPGDGVDESTTSRIWLLDESRCYRDTDEQAASSPIRLNLGDVVDVEPAGSGRGLGGATVRFVEVATPGGGRCFAPEDWIDGVPPQDLNCSSEDGMLSAVTTSDLAEVLRGASLRVTRPRLAVLAAVHEHPHADTDAVIGLARAELGAVSHQAVYDVLRALTDAGLVRRIQPAGATARYEARVDDNHHHVVCRSCGAIADVDCAVGHTPCLTASDDHGFTVDEAEVVYWGTCPGCAAAGTPSNTSSNTVQ